MDSLSVSAIVARRRSRLVPRAFPAWVESLERRQLLEGSGLTAPLPGLASPAAFGSLEELKATLIDQAVKSWSWSFGTTVPRGGGIIALPVLNTTAGQTPTSRANLAAPSLTGHSGTNTQVNGVDEGDLVETDGRFLYVLSGQRLTIVDTRDPGQLATAASVDLPSYPIAQYLTGTRLTILTQDYGAVFIDSVAASTRLAGPGILPAPTEPKVHVLEYDVADPSAPTLVRESSFDGHYLQSRAVGDRLYLVLSQWIEGLPTPELRGAGPKGLVYESEASYRARLERVDVADLLPTYRSTAFNAAGRVVSGQGPLIGPANLYKPATAEDQGLLTIVTLDTARSGGTSVVGSLGVMANGASTAYLSAEGHLYLASTTWVTDPPGQTGAGSEATLIRRFDLKGDEPVYSSIGVVPGSPLNQFALDEHDGRLRVATTLNRWNEVGSTTTNNLYVLEQHGAKLETVGTLENLAPGERIFAVRFVEDRAFLVTFRQVDPLFAIDLGDPTAPEMVGELKVPGFSRYLHPVDATHLIGIGRDADPETGRTRGLQVSLFDVEDLANPMRIDVETIAGDWNWSEAEHNHLAVLYVPETGTLAIPVSGTSANGPDGPWSESSALMVFKVGAADGLDVLGQVDHTGPVLRGLRIGEVLYSLSQNQIKSSELANPSRVLGQLEIQKSIPPSPVPRPLPASQGPRTRPFVKPRPILLSTGRPRPQPPATRPGRTTHRPTVTTNPGTTPRPRLAMISRPGIRRARPL